MKKENSKTAGEKDEDNGFTRQQELETQMDKGHENEEDEWEAVMASVEADLERREKEEAAAQQKKTSSEKKAQAKKAVHATADGIARNPDLD